MLVCFSLGAEPGSLCPIFSKVSSRLDLLHKGSVELTFENFYQQEPECKEQVAYIPKRWMSVPIQVCVFFFLNALGSFSLSLFLSLSLSLSLSLTHTHTYTHTHLHTDVSEKWLCVPTQMCVFLCCGVARLPKLSSTATLCNTLHHTATHCITRVPSYIYVYIYAYICI